jgi:hypothetical protein
VLCECEVHSTLARTRTLCAQPAAETCPTPHVYISAPRACFSFIKDTTKMLRSSGLAYSRELDFCPLQFVCFTADTMWLQATVLIALLGALFPETLGGGERRYQHRPPRARESCFEDQVEASSIACDTLAQFWRDLTATGCDVEEASEVVSVYFVQDIPVRIDGELVSTGLEECIQAFVASGIIPTLCATRYVSFSTHSVDIVESGHKFLWKANENLVPRDPNDAVYGREFLFEMDEGCRATVASIRFVDEFAM